MKKYLLFILSLSFLPLMSMAQVELKSNGKTIFGDPGSLWNSNAAATVSVYGTGTGTYPKISFGELTKNSNGYYSGAFVGEWKGDYGNKRLWLEGSNGFYLTAGGKDSSSWVDNVLMCYETIIPEDAIYMFKTLYMYSRNIKGVSDLSCSTVHASGDIYARGVLLTSDARLKSDIKKIGNTLGGLLKLEGVTYRFVDEPKIDLPQKPGDAVNETKEPIPDRERTGFLAQDLEKVFPNLVITDTTGYKSVDYIGLIPVIVEALKEQQSLITAQSLKIAELQSAQGEAVLMPEGSAQSRMTATQSESRLDVEETTAVNAFLYQNAPNPFNVRTEIRYYLPQEVASATLYLFNMQGALVKNFSLPARGEGTQTVEASELAPGMYIYSLVADNREVDAKRMIVTE